MPALAITTAPIDTERAKKPVLILFANLPLCLIGLGACTGVHLRARELLKPDAIRKQYP